VKYPHFSLLRLKSKKKSGVARAGTRVLRSRETLNDDHRPESPDTASCQRKINDGKTGKSTQFDFCEKKKDSGDGPGGRFGEDWVEMNYMGLSGYTEGPSGPRAQEKHTQGTNAVYVCQAGGGEPPKKFQGT